MLLKWKPKVVVDVECLYTLFNSCQLLTADGRHVSGVTLCPVSMSRHRTHLSLPAHCGNHREITIDLL